MLSDRLSRTLSQQLDQRAQVMDLSEFDCDSLLTHPAEKPVFIFMATYTDGTPPNNAKWFYEWLQDMRFDFRVSKTALTRVRFCVFGLGHHEYKANFCTVARNVDAWLCGLGAQKMLPVELGDAGDDLEAQYERWEHLVVEYLRGPIPEAMEAFVTSEEEQEELSDAEGAGTTGSDTGEMLDLEDFGKVATSLKKAVQDKSAEEMARLGARRAVGDTKVAAPKKMVTPLLEKSLTKQGYKIVGTHSGVKLCRWTKSMLRGRGGCYKHTNYGIESHRCMETTPSLGTALLITTA